MNERGWPFLVARGRRRGFRTVLAPEFLVRPRLHGLLAEAPETDGQGPRAVELHPAQLGPMTILYETEVMTAAELHAPAGTARDEHGRELEIRYGLVLRGHERDTAVDGDLRVARDAALRSYRRFLDDEEGFDVDASLPVGGRVLAPIALEPPPVSSERRAYERRALPLRAAAGVAAVAVVCVAAALLVPRPRVPHFRLSVTPEDVECGDPAGVALNGQVAADGAVTLKVHWQTPSGPLDAGELRFDRRGMKPIGRVYRVSLGANARIRLVAEASGVTRRSEVYRVRCAQRTVKNARMPARS